MNTLEQKLNLIKKKQLSGKTKIMIIGLGSVGMYLLDYLLSSKDEQIDICVAGRNIEKMQSDVNIASVSSLIRGCNRTPVQIIPNVDLNDVSSITNCLKKNQPDLIINTSRAYPGLKYGSISWTNIRAYGIWAPLAIKYVKNIMEAYKYAASHAVVINTSYSDAVISWLKSAGKPYPDFGSGNINHLIPRLKLAVAKIYSIQDYWNIDITYAVSHFHDVVISKEGKTEGINQLIHISYNNKTLTPDMDHLFSMCKIPMPVDAKRNMMNASSNYEIIQAILNVTRQKKRIKLHCPGIFGEIGGYPVILDSTGERITVSIDNTFFSIDDMRQKNKESIYLDGIENICNGSLYYTDELIKKTKDAFRTNLMKSVPFSEIENAADFLISEIIQPALKH